MAEGDFPQTQHPADARAGMVLPFPAFLQTAFNRHELNEILRLYGRKVAEGKWRDYAIDMLRDRAIFSIFQRTSDVPLYRVEKNPANARRQGAYSVISAGGMVLRRGHDLGNVLKAIEKS